MKKAFFKFKVVILAISLFLVSSIPFFPVEAYDGFSNIKVGIYYSSSAKSAYSVDGRNLQVSVQNNNILPTRENNISVSAIGQIFIENLGLSTYEEAKAMATNYGDSSLVFYDGASYYPGAVSFHNNLTEASSKKNIYVRSLGGEKIVVAENSEVSISSEGDTIGLENKSYRGTLIFINNGTKLNAINQLSMDEYLYGVVPSEMPALWEEEALKAQGVVARNYAISNYNKHRVDGFNVCASTHCQVYGGYSNEHVNTNRAVDLTSGISMYYNEKVVEGYFHSSSGGRTESSENIWANPLPYLKGVNDPYSIGNTFDNWQASFTSAEVKSSLYGNGIDVGDIIGMKITKTSENGRAVELSILGTKGIATLQKDKIRTVLGSSKLKSTYISLKGESVGATVTENIANSSLKSKFNGLSKFAETMITNTDFVSGPTFTFTGKGYGHGVGLSQYGANSMAKQGYNYKEILKYYFTGVEIY